MKRWERAVYTVVVLLVGLIASVQLQANNNQKAEMLLQEAEHKASLEGDLEQAIQLCEQILSEHKGNRTVAANALIQMGNCYDKLGRTDVGLFRVV